MRAITASLMLLMATGVSTPALAADNFSLYSDACYNVEGGDLLGHRVGILRLPDDVYVFVQVAEGVWTDPFIAKASAADIKRGKLIFSFPDKEKRISFRGTIGDKSVIGRFDGWLDFKGKPLMVHLARMAASKKGAPNC